MDANQYVKQATRTESQNFDEIGSRLCEKRNIRLLHAAMGLETEVGEFMDPLKKHIFYGKEIDTVNLAEELGDMFWYIAIACDELGVKPLELMEKNIAKLKARFPDKFSSKDAIERDTSKERKILEQQSFL